MINNSLTRSKASLSITFYLCPLAWKAKVVMRINFLALLLLALVGSPRFADAADLEILRPHRLSRGRRDGTDFMLA